jgi:dTDP-4-amino-4,6-dideoxygalactose transaminase
MEVRAKQQQTIPFSRPTLTGEEFDYLKRVFEIGKFSGKGYFSKSCRDWFEQNYGTTSVLMTPSCTHALEIAAMLAEVGPGDEVILPSFTFTSSATAFVRCGASLVFVDVRPDTMNIDPEQIERAITNRTKVIVTMDYAGVACDYDRINEIARAHGLIVVEDAAQALLCTYNDKWCGTLGDLGCFSFHETKNLHCGEGGALVAGNKDFFVRAEIIQEKGTDRSRFLRGEVDKYTWQDVGSSYELSEINGSILRCQLEHAKAIMADRRQNWELYQELLAPLARTGMIGVPHVPHRCVHNGHIYYIKTKNKTDRDGLIAFLKAQGAHSTFHYVPLHSAPAGLKFGRFHGEDRWTTRESERLLRLPLYHRMEETHVTRVANAVREYYGYSGARMSVGGRVLSNGVP